MRHRPWFVVLMVLIGLLALACGPAAPAAQPAAPAPQPAKPAAPAAQPAAPAPQPAKPAAEAPKPAAPAAQPAKPAAQAAKPAAPAPAAKEGVRLIHGTSQLSSSFGIYSAALVKLLNSKIAGLNVTLTEYGSIVNNLKMTREGKADFAMGDHTIQYLAYVGELKGWEGNPQKDLRLLWAFSTIANAVILSERENIKSVNDLHGKSFNPGGQGTSAEVVVTNALDVLGIKPLYLRGTMSEATEAFKNRRVVGFVKASAPTAVDPLVMEAKTALPVRILSWPEDAIKKVQAKYPAYKSIQIPAGVYQEEWNKQPITTWGSSTSIFTNTKLDENLAYQFVKTVLADKEEQALAFPALKGLDIGKVTMENGVVPLHKGALKAFREAGYQIPKDLVPPEAQ
ncbi:MAG: TAXI family TRAP transporter solute-binding subunit [Chloroflexi bacterium]|nr:TAXI family TRAP transporter solute-binding subunit [Chloroflexota bacterium]